MERSRPLSRLERHSQQSSDAMARGRRSRERVPHAVEQQQRQYLRLPGPAGICEHLTRRVTRYELDGSVTIIADNYNGKRLNSPNDVVPHPDGSLWFTDPPYGGQLYEGAPDAAGGPSNAAGHLNPKLGQPAGFVPGKRELPTNCYRWDPSGKLDLVVTEEQVPDPNGLCFSPDYKKLYVISTGKGPGDTGPGGKGDISVFDVGADNKLSNQKLFTDCVIDGVKCGPDGMRCRRGRQSLGLEQRWPRGRLQRRDGVEPCRKAHRPHPYPGDRRQRLLRRPQAQPVVHGREPVALRALHSDSGGGSRLNPAESVRARLNRRQAVDDATRRPQVRYAMPVLKPGPA